MWIGTENGLNRFDGHSFLVYQPGQPKLSISNASVNDIEEDRHGRLWVATQLGLNKIDTKKDSTTVFISDKKDGIPSDLIWDIYIDRHDRVWIAPDNRDLCFYDMNKNAFTKIPWIEFVKKYFPDRQNKYNSIRKIYYKSDDELWLGTTMGLVSYRISTNQFTYHKRFNTDHFIQLETAPDKKTVFFTQNLMPAFEMLNVETGSISEILWKDISVNTFDRLRNKNCNNYLWLPAGKNIVEINTINGEALLIAHEADDPYSLPNGTIRSTYRDNAGLIWVATSNGIGKFNPAMSPFPFTKVLPLVKSKEEESNDFFRFNHPLHTVFYSQQDNKYYIGSPATNSLIIHDGTTGENKMITSVNGIPLQGCSVVFEDSKGMLWILAGTSAFCYDRSNHRFTISSFRADKRNVLFADMAEDQDGNLWIACFNDGLYRYDPKKEISIKYDERNQFSKLPTSLYFDKEQNKLLIGTFGNGVYACDTRQLLFNRFMKDVRSIDHTRFSLITDITKDKTGRLWVASYATGIARIDDYADNRKIQVRLITRQEGLPENNIYAIQADFKGNVWAATYEGITRLNADGRIIENYNRRTGLHFDNFYSPFTQTAKGELLTGVGEGFIRFHPDSLPYSSPDFPIVLTGVRPKDSTETGSFSYINNDIRFNFAALSYASPTQTRYEYILQGMDKYWVNAGNTTMAQYNNLLHGSYQFKVRAVDFTGKYSINTAGFTFTIRPPWWQTWWFGISVALVIAGTVYFLFRQEIRRFKNKAGIRQQMVELKGKALRAQMNPHFIFNCLNAIQELIVREQYDASYKYLSKFSRLLRMVLDTSEKNFIPLSSEIEMCMLYLELESMRFQHSFEYSLQVDPTIDPETTLIPSLLMQPFIENAVWHGLLMKEGEKKLSIRFAEQDGRLVCIIQDNGIGRKRSSEIKAQKIGSHHFDSRGIQMAKQRIENLRADGTHNADIEITDCKDENGNATGTIVQITISSSENKQS